MAGGFETLRVISCGHITFILVNFFESVAFLIVASYAGYFRPAETLYREGVNWQGQCLTEHTDPTLSRVIDTVPWRSSPLTNRSTPPAMAMNGTSGKFARLETVWTVPMA